MNTQNDSGFRTFQATAVALEAFVRVTVDSNGLISAAGASDVGIGVTQEAIAASGYGNVKLFGAPGTFLMQTAGPVTRGAALYAAAAGEVDDTGTYALRMVALEAATAQGDVIEMAPMNGEAVRAYPWASGDVGTVAAAGNSQGTATAIEKSVTYVTASDGAKGVVLPTASAGATYVVYNTVAAALLLYPNTSDDINDGTVNVHVSMAAKTVAICTAVDATTWAVAFTSA
jgi:hypothetical protein